MAHVARGHLVRPYLNYSAVVDGCADFELKRGSAARVSGRTIGVRLGRSAQMVRPYGFRSLQ